MAKRRAPSNKSQKDLYDNKNQTGLGASEVSNPPVKDGDKKPTKKLTPDEERKLVFEVMKQYERGAGAEAENRRLFSEDLRFVYQDTIEADGQWDSAILLQRRGRPSYTFNRVIGAVNLVLGDQRQTRPQARVRAANSQASVETADIFNGLIRDIEQSSGAETIYDSQFKNAVAGGYGAWRIVPDYENDQSFDQVLKIKDIPNPLTVLWDPEATCPIRSDSMWCIVAERISHEKYKALYPDHDPVSLSFSRDARGWATENEVRVAEYFKKVPVYKTLAQLSNGRVVDYDDDFKEIEKHHEDLSKRIGQGPFPHVTRTREVKTWAVEWYLVDAANVLAGPIRYNWKRIPVIRCPGRCINIEGKQKVQSLVRHTKDPQRTYNYHRSTMVELAALTPRAPYIATPKMVKGYEDMWATANTNARPYLLYDPDPDVPGERPTREPPPDVPEALIALAQADLADIQAATGYFDASLGNDEESDRTSGKALVARQRRSDLGSYEFIDNFGKALKVSHECIVDMAPSTYDTNRIVRIIGQDGVEKYEQINGIGPNGLINSLKEGAYDVTVTIGPSYQTARQEMLATLLEAANVLPQISQMAPDLIVKNIDTPDSEELVRRLRILLIQQGVVKPTPQEQKQMPPPAQPDPMVQAQVALAQAKAQQSQAQAQLAGTKVQAAPLQHQELMEKIIHSRMDAMLDARKAGVEHSQGKIDLMQSQLESQQSLHQSGQQFQQDQQQDQQQHAQDMAHAQQQHAQGVQQQAQQSYMDNLTQAAQAVQGVKHTQVAHQQKLTHTQEMHEAKLTAAKQMAKAKPKPASKK